MTLNYYLEQNAFRAPSINLILDKYIKIYRYITNSQYLTILCARNALINFKLKI